VHIIIEQAKWQQHVVCLVSIWQEQFSLHSLDSWAHRAYSVEQLQNAASMLRVTELTTACRLGTCRITMRGFPFTLFDLEHLDAAENIVIRLHEPSRVEDEMDDMDLMQRQQGSANQQALDMTVKTEEYSGFRHLNPDAPIFTPGAPNFWTQPQDVHDLHAVWRTGAFAWQDEVPAAHFQVWFLCPGGGLQRCLHSRRITFNDDVTEWRDRLFRL